MYIKTYTFFLKHSEGNENILKQFVSKLQISWYFTSKHFWMHLLRVKIPENPGQFLVEGPTIQLSHCRPSLLGHFPPRNISLHGFTCLDCLQIQGLLQTPPPWHYHLLSSFVISLFILHFVSRTVQTKTQSCSQGACSAGVGGTEQVTLQYGGLREALGLGALGGRGGVPPWGWGWPEKAFQRGRWYLTREPKGTREQVEPGQIRIGRRCLG